jgi:hypothetical protein
MVFYGLPLTITSLGVLFGLPLNIASSFLLDYHKPLQYENFSCFDLLKQMTQKIK